MEQKIYNEYVEILKEELLPAMGCTEPIAVAYAAAGGESEIPVFYCGFLCAAGMYAVLYFLSDHEYETGSDRDGYLDAGSTVSVYG